MLIYDLRGRFLNFRDEATPTYPADATISAELAPRTPFGGEVGLTRSATRDRDAKISARVSPSTGTFFFDLHEPLFPKLDARSAPGEVVFSIKGHVASVEARVESLQEVTDLLGALCYVFPAVLNLELLDSPYVRYAWGEIGGAKFQWHFDPRVLQGSIEVTSKELREASVVRSWEQTSLVRRSSRMFRSLEYFRTACRLLTAGQNRFEFMAEAVLNLAKCLQSLGGETRDDVRKVLGQLGVSSGEIEALYVPALFLRGYFDVAHISLTQYKDEELRTLHEYVDLAEGAFRRLLKRALELFERRDFTPASSSDEGSSAEKAAIIKTIGDNLRSFQDGCDAAP